MKRSFTFLMAAFALMVCMTMPLGMKGQTYAQVTELDLTTKAYGCSAYNTSTNYTSNNLTWVIVNGANNNKGWEYFKMGGKNTTISDYNPCYIYSPAISQQVDKVTVHLPAGSLSKNGMSVNSWGLYVYSNSTMTTQVDYVAGGTITNSEASFDFTPSTGAVWAANYYYKVSWNLANTTTTNGIVCVDKITLYKESTGATYTVTYDCNGGTSGCPSNQTGIAAGTGITLAVAPTKTDYTFDGWSDGTNTYQAGASYTVNGNVTMTAQWTANASGDEQWALTSLADLTSDDVFVIVGNNGSNYAMSNDGGTTNAPAAVAVTIANDEITSTVAANIQWNVSGNATNGYTFYPNGSQNRWLYCSTTNESGSNNNMRVGTGDRKVFELSSNIIQTKDNYTTRYLSLYVNNGVTQDWRGYVNTNSAPTISFYKKVTGGSTPSTCATPTFSPAAGTYTSAQNVSISCATDGATIYYTTNGSEPTTSSSVYTSAIAVSETTTIKAMAVKTDMANSAVATATYTITTPCTINFNAGNGSCSTTSMEGASGSSISLPTATPSTTCAEMGWIFAGWAASSVDFTTTTPTLYTGSYTITNSTTLYAVYKIGDGSGESFEYVFSEQSFSNAQEIFSDEMDATSGIGWAATTGGSYTPKYYDTGKGLRVYNGGTFTITTNNNTISAVSLTFSSENYTFNANDSNPTTWSGNQSTNITWNVTRTCRLQKVNVTYGTLTYTYATSPDCWDPIATPTFSPAGGSYNATQNVTITCATDGTTIHYTTDGTTPTANSATYSNPLTVGNGTTTVKAIAVKDGHSSDVATATYIIDSNQAGGEDNPYTVAQAIAATPASGTSDWVYVKGVVSEILEIEVMQYHNARYYISDDSITSSTRLLSFRGRNIYNSDFLSEDELLVGDTVVIRGKLKKYDDEPELDEGNYIVSRTRAVEPVTFSPESCIMSSDNYGVFLFSESINEGWGTDIFYSIGANSDPIANGEYFDFWGDPIEVTQNTIIRAVAYIPDLDKYSAVTEATYTIVSPQSSGWQGNPYTVSEALDALDQNNNIKGAYVKGVISRISQIETTRYYNATYFISDDGEENDELQVYRGKYISRADFTSQDDILIGDTVIVFGDLTIYKRGNDSIKEFKPKNYIWDLSRPSSIVINQNQLEIDCNGASGIIDVTYSDDIYVNTNNPTLQFCDAQGNTTSYDWLTVTLSQNTDWDLEYVISPNDGNQPRTAYLKVSCQGLVSNMVTITQNEYRPDFAELPFSFDGGRGDIASTAGLTGKNLGDDYSSSPKLKFENKTENGVIKVSSLVLKINEVPGVLTFKIKGNNFNGGTFKVQASADGVVYSDMATYRTLNNQSAETKTINNLPTATRYIRWIYVTKSTGNVGVGDIHLAKPIIEFNITCEQPYYAGTQVGTITANKAAAVEGETITLNATPYNGYVFLEWNVEDSSHQPVAVADSSAANTTFLMPYDNVTVSAVMLPINTEYHYAYSINGTVGQLQTATIGTTLTLPAGSGLSGQPFAFVGWTTNPNNVENVMSAGASYRLLRDVTFYAVYVESVAGTSADKHYVRVTEDLEQNWAGDYLIAYSSAIFADGRVSGTTSGGIGCANVSVAPGNNLHDNMVETIWGDIYRVTLEEVAAGSDTYLLKTQDGNYNYYTNNTNNGLTATANRDLADNYPITVNFMSANDIRLSLGGDAEGSVFRYNPQGFFRFYKNCGQEPVYLYKKTLSTDNRYTRVFVNEQASASLVIEGPSIVPSGQVLNVTSITNNLGADRLVIAEGGQLVTANDVNATIRRFINFYQGEYDNYYLISTPVDGQDPEDAGMTGGEFDLYAFDQSAQGAEWRNYEAGSFAALETGKGYLYANDYGGYITMSGLMEAPADDVTVEHVSGKPFAGWNLIGNPYPCNVTIGRPFYRLASGGAALATEATDRSVAIAPMEGVFVCADGTETVSFTKAPTTSTTSGRNLLSMRVSRSRGSKDERIDADNAIVRFGEGDQLRKLVLNPDLTQLYVAQDGRDYAIVNAEAEGEIPVSFRPAENGSYIFSVAAEGVTMRYLHLIDHKTGADVDLLKTPSYTFEANTGDYEGRFKLVFACGDTNDGNETFAYYNGSQWVVSNEGEATLQVVDMMGRVLSSQSIKGNAEVNVDRAAGVYLLRLMSGDDVKVQKIVIQ